MRRLLILTVLLLSACQPVQQADTDFDVIYHPDGGLFVGDRVSIEVVPPPGWNVGEQQVRVSVGEKLLGNADFYPAGVGQRDQTTFMWIWDTKDLEEGGQILNYSILPEGPSWQDEIQLGPAEKRPYPQSAWAKASSDCCLLEYITGTDAERDVELLKRMVDEQAVEAGASLQTELNETMTITFLPRLLGHGGFVSNGIYVTYLDENIAGNTTSQVILHEMVHALDRRLGGDFLPNMLVEGLAVYLSGGHFKSEALLPRAAALLELDTYIPLKTLVENFYFEQHEIGYLEAGALVEYMVDRYGWEEYQSFYRNMEPKGDQAEAFEAGLIENFGISLEQLEKDFLNELKGQVISEDVLNDLQLTVAFYDSLRHYQKVLDPSAFFLTAWIPDGEVMRQEGITADYVRAPERLDNLVFESLLRNANHLIVRGDFFQAEIILDVVNFLLALYPS
jgi:hypothetical protein